MLFRKLVIVLVLIFTLTLGLIYFLSQYTNPKIDRSQAVLSAASPPDKTLVFVGDSMTAYLGNFDELRSELKKYYPDKNLLLLNYGFGSTNILSVEDRIEKESTYSGRIFKPINQINFDLIFIESFGHNPLSEYPLQEGLKKQTESLDRIVKNLKKGRPNAKIIFIATIAPNRNRYAEGAVVLSPEERIKWVKEREEYIKNHIEYAKSRNIPLINIYQKSLDPSGTGNINYINTRDFIHPSPKGVYFISEEIAKFIRDNKLL